MSLDGAEICSKAHSPNPKHLHTSERDHPTSPDPTVRGCGAGLGMPLRGRTSFMLAVLGAGVGFNCIGTYVVLTSDRRENSPMVGGTENAKHSASSVPESSLAPAPKPKRWGLW